MLHFLVIRPINGRTDWYDLAAFDNAGDADSYAEEWNKLNPVTRLGEYPAEVCRVRKVRYEFVEMVPA